MRFSNKVSLEKREFLQELYKEFIQNNQITKEEKKELLKWIYNGNSPYDNFSMGWTDYGSPLTFIEDYRIYQETKDMSIDEQKAYFGYDD